jgi:hypothetical protein
MPRIQIKRGLKANLPSSSMLAGEQFFTLDKSAMYIATDATTKLPVVPPIDDLTTLTTVDGTADLVAIFDASESSEPPLKKMTFNAFKTALNIPASSSDEKVACASGSTAGYLYGDGTNGVLRMSGSMSWTLDSGGNFATIAVGVVDCGTFP